MNDMHDGGAGGGSDKFEPLFAIDRDHFSAAFEPGNVILLARLKLEDPARYQALRQKWRQEKFPGQTDLTRAVDKALAKALRKGSERRDSARSGGPAPTSDDNVSISPDDPRATARAFVRDVRPNLIFNNGSWLDYRLNCYVEIEEKHIRSDVWSYLGGAVDAERGKLVRPTPAMVTAVIDALTGLCFRERQAFMPPAWFERTAEDPAPSETIACANGLLHIPTGRLLPLSSRFFTYNGLPYEYDEPAFDFGPVQWLAFLNDIWPGSPESIEALQEIFGYLLTNDTRQQKIFLIVGPPRSGKGTIGRVLTSLLGKDNCTSPSLKALGKDFGMESLIGKQVMLVSDMRVSRNTDTGEITGNILRISGEDDVNVSRKFRDDWRGKLSTRIVLLSNVPLVLPDMSGALINRIVPLVLKKSYLGHEDIALSDKLLTELPSILNWAIAGWKRLNDRGHFALTPEGQEMNRYASSHAAPVQTFLSECCETGPKLKIVKEHLFAAFELWADESDVTRFYDHGTFGRELHVASGYRIETTRPRDGAGRQVPHYSGVKLKPEWAKRLAESGKVS